MRNTQYTMVYAGIEVIPCATMISDLKVCSYFEISKFTELMQKVQIF